MSSLLPFLVGEGIWTSRVLKAVTSFFRADSTLVKIHTSEVDREPDVNVVMDYVSKNTTSLETTSHWWFADASDDDDKLRSSLVNISQDPSIRSEFERMFSPLFYDISPVWEMNEIYVSTLSVATASSDTVFYSKHIDGPLGFFYGCYVYRIMYGLNENIQLITRFPQKPYELAISKYDAVGFDFNREIHYIVSLNGRRNSAPRANLKLHYVVVPKILSWFMLRPLSRLAIFYDRKARDLFLYTLKPSTAHQYMSAYFVLFTTHLTRWFEQLVGFNNTLYLLIIGLFLSDYWVVLTSFVHYLFYMTTWHFRENVSYHSFVRNVTLFKGIMFCNMAYMVCQMDHVNWSFLWCGVVTVGLVLSTSATFVLGTYGTYFGVEFNIVKPNRLTSFPYNITSHPMILGQILAHVGIYHLFLPNIPFWWVAGHVFMYILHGLQEHWQHHLKI
jgi:hypothetical protein